MPLTQRERIAGLVALAATLTSLTLAAADGSTPDPIASAIARQSARLAVNPQESVDVAWARVRKLDAGTDVILTVGGSPPRERSVVSADRSVISVLNVADSALPTVARKALSDVTSSHPEYFSTARLGGTVVLENGLRLQPDGVFLHDRKLADLAYIVETIARTDVVEVRIRQRGRGVWGHLGPLGGYFIGALSGGFGVGLACQAAVGRDRCDTGAFLTGGLIGGVAGGVYGFHAARRETESVIYTTR